jgi:hypothetical protein
VYLWDFAQLSRRQRIPTAISAAVLGLTRWSVQSWQNRMAKLRDGRLPGSFFATTRAKLREIAERLGTERPLKLGGYVVQWRDTESRRIATGR